MPGLSIASAVVVASTVASVAIAAGNELSQKPKATAAVWEHPMTMETGIDDGFLPCADPILHPTLKHGNTADAFGGLGKALGPQGPAVIVGHGNVGMFCTGDGSRCLAAAKIVTYRNGRVWTPLAQQIAGKVSMLRLLACDVGAEKEGADLLYQIAQIVKAPVTAPNDLVWCRGGKVELDASARWQTATPSTRPAPIPLPPYTVKPTQTLSFRINGADRQVPASAVKLLELRNTSFAQDGGLTTLVVTPSLAAQLIPLIDFGNPFRPNGIPAAMETARLRLEIVYADSPIQREFIVYNDRLVRDAVERDVYYRTDSQFSQRLRSFRQ